MIEIHPTPLRRLLLALAACVSLAGGATAPAQEGAIRPRWIWYPTEGQPGAETRYFRNTVDVKEPGSKLAVDVTADNSFVLYLDGKELLRGDDWRTVKHATATLSAGLHVLAVEATNEAPGPAGLLVAGSIQPLGQGLRVHSGRHWKTAATVPPGDAWKQVDFDDSTWARPADLGELGTGPWQGLAYTSADAALRFTVPSGFEVRSVAAPEVTGSAVSFAFDHEGRPCVGIERGPIVRLIDADRDGSYEGRAVITPQMQNCQGLCFDVDRDGAVTLWAIGDGPKGTGIYRLADADGDGAFEAVLHYVPTDGMGEHGPHAIARGPDGMLYFNAGNHAHIKQPIDPKSPVNAASKYEGELLPHYGDSRGHAVNILAPGGEIYRSDDDGVSWKRIVGGFRNEYDFAFSRDGEIFSFDSDMEWDIGLPWYRPVRVNFCPPGAELGWRNGSAVWPEWYYDSLPSTLDVGRGSPTGVAFYQGSTFPAKYDDAFLICDWSQGRILAVFLKPQGASYAATMEPLVTGQPLNCTDIEVGPDGAVYFTTGGRGTLGGLFRVAPVAPREPAARRNMNPVEEAIELDSPLSAFGRKRLVELRRRAGDGWTESLVQLATNKAAEPRQRVRAIDLLNVTGTSTPERPLERLYASLATQDAEAPVRAKAVQVLGQSRGEEARAALIAALADREPAVRRRACEALVRTQGEIPIEPLLPLLGDADRWVRYAARVALEHGDPNALRNAKLPEGSPRPLLEWMLAVVRVDRPTGEAQRALLERQVALWSHPKLAADERLDLLRLIALTYHLGGGDPAQMPASATLRRHLLAAYPSGDVRLDREQARLLAFLDEPAAIAKILEHQAGTPDRAEQIHDTYCLRAIKQGWTPQAKRQLWAWFETASGWEGGYSYLGYLDFMVQELVAKLDEPERAAYLAEGARYPFPTRVLVRALDLGRQTGRVADLTSLYRGLDPSINPNATNELRALILEKLGRSSTPQAHAALRELSAADPPRRDLIARAIANHPTAEDLPLLVAALESRDPNTTNAVVAALRRLPAVPEGPDALRRLILLARRTGPAFLDRLNALASKWTGLDAPQGDFVVALAEWEKRYTERFPNAPSLAEAAAGQNAYTYDSLMDQVVRSGLYQKASSERGREVLNRAKCLDCHKFGDQGQGLGPDLTTVSSRFRPHEILESIVEPSKVISDQYQSIAVALADGRILNGMPAGGDADNLILLLSDGTKVTLPKADIEEQQVSKTSVMPEGLLNALTIQEIAELLRLFDAQPRVESPAPKP